MSFMAAAFLYLQFFDSEDSDSSDSDSSDSDGSESQEEEELDMNGLEGCNVSFEFEDTDSDDSFYDDDDRDSAFFGSRVARFKGRSVQDPTILAVITEDIDSLMKLSDTTEWYKYIHGPTGNTLLHFTIMYGRKDLFHHLLSFADFPFHHKNKKHETVLDTCLIGRSLDLLDHFACELMKKGLFINLESQTKKKILHYAVEYSLVELSKYLMLKGYDVNLSMGGVTPFWLCLTEITVSEKQEEIATALLCHDVDPWIGNHDGYNAFEYSVISCSEIVQEALFHLMFDDYTLMDLHFEVLLLLAHNKSYFFQDTLKHVKNVTVGDAATYCYRFLFSIDVDDLHLLIKKCPDAILEILLGCRFLTDGVFYKRQFLINLSALVESDLRDGVISFICRNCAAFIDFSIVVQPLPSDLTIISENVCFLLSYGLELKEDLVRSIHKTYGFGELFKIILHTKIRQSHLENYPFLELVYDVECDLDQIIDNIYRYRIEDLTDLNHYFADKRLRNLSIEEEEEDNEEADEEVIAPGTNQPEVPLLVELARNAFRKFFVKTLEIKNAGQFYSLVKKLPVANVHKQIINYEQRLY